MPLTAKGRTPWERTTLPPGRSYRDRIESYLRRNPGASVAEARGHRGPRDAERAIRTGTAVSSFISARDERGRVKVTTIVVTGKDGLDRTFRIRRDTPKGKAAAKKADREFDRKLRKIAKTIKTSDAPYHTYPRKDGTSTHFDKVMEAA